MGCVVCGGETKGGALLCGACLDRMEDPLALIPSALDPTSDQRLFLTSSASLRIGPTSSAEVALHRGIEPALRLRELAASSNTAGLSRLANHYLAALGIGLYIMGDERIPRRPIIWSVVQKVKEADPGTREAAEASVRSGNVLALLVRQISRLPIDASAAITAMARHAESARTCYSRASRFSDLSKVAEIDLALTDHWQGNSGAALASLEDLSRFEGSGAVVPHAEIAKAIILHETGRTAEAVQILGRLPEALEEDAVLRLRIMLGAGR